MWWHSSQAIWPVESSWKYTWNKIPTGGGYYMLKIADTNFYLTTELHYNPAIKEPYLYENAPTEWWSAQWAFDPVE
jgi:hypothetical protein